MSKTASPAFRPHRPPSRSPSSPVSAFISAKFDKILALEPDLSRFFGLADIARELISRGVNVVFNQRSVDEILT